MFSDYAYDLAAQRTRERLTDAQRHRLVRQARVARSTSRGRLPRPGRNRLASTVWRMRRVCAAVVESAG
jgi:hypothetical protein